MKALFVLAIISSIWIKDLCGAPAAIAIAVAAAAADDANGQASGVGVNSLPYGPFYCQARCLASCVETNLANSLDECTKFCPPFDSAMPCPPGNADCWRNCGIPPTPRDKPPPPAVNFVMAQHVSSPDQRLQDPFTIELTWDPAPSASLYIVELYPLNRQPRQGENNFFRALTSFPTYMVRKEDECTTYDIRVMPVNAFGIGAPQYTRIEAPRPTMVGGEDFHVRHIRREPTNGNFVLVTIDYLFPAPWPVADVDLVGLRVKATQCRGMSPQQNKGSTDNTGDWYPFYDLLIGKTPTTSIHLAFLNDVVKSDCLFQMRISALATRCNTTTYFDSNGGANQDSTVGVDFRINCRTAEGYDCGNSVESKPPFIMIQPADESFVAPPAVNMPIPPPVPTQIRSGNETASSPIVPEGAFTISQLPQPEMHQPSNADGPSVTIGSGNINMHQLLIDYLAINSQIPIPTSCDVETIDVQPSPSMLGPGMVDLTVSWLEKNPMAPRAPSYFVVRYGPIVRTLIEDSRRPHRIIAGHENIVRTGVQPTASQFSQQIGGHQPERRVKINGVPKSGLLSFQVCAMYDVNSEPLIAWDMVSSQHIDLIALQTPSNNENNIQSILLPNGVITSLAPLATDESPLTAGGGGSIDGGSSMIAIIPSSNNDAVNNNNNGDNAALKKDENGDSNDDDDDDQSAPPVVVKIGLINASQPMNTFWPILVGGVFLALVTAFMVFLFILRLWMKRGPGEKKEKITYLPSVPIAMITKPHIQPPPDKAMEAEKEPEKIALP